MTHSLQRGLVLIAAALFIAPAAAGSPSFLSPQRGTVLEAGSRIAIAWPTIADSNSANELELLLSVDGGRTFPVRVTRDLPIDTNGYIWRVPYLRSSRARLALRAGEDESPGSERVRFVSDEFRIEFPPGSGFERLYPAGPELRTREALAFDHPDRDAFGELGFSPLTNRIASRRWATALAISSTPIQTSPRRSGGRPVDLFLRSAVRPLRLAALSSQAPTPLRL